MQLYRALLAGCATTICLAATARAETDNGAVSADDIIVTAPGAGEDEGLRVLDDGAITRTGVPDLLSALETQLPGISLQHAQGNPWQPNLSWRGFTASPLQGQAQGIAVYLDGARFNQPFGDTVGFDLIPDAALAEASLRDGDAVYGLNALAGALVMRTRTGSTDPGIEASLAAGDYGAREASVAMGAARGALSGYVAAQHREEDGWRDHSPSRLGNIYLDLGWDIASAGIHAKFIGADTDLTGNGVAPVELLEARRRSVFSWPDNSQSRYGRLSLHPWIGLGSGTRLEASIYRQRLRVSTVNGDNADIEECEDEPGNLCLEDDIADDETELTDIAGDEITAVDDVDAYGLLNRGFAHTRSSGVLLQLIDERRLAGVDNRLVLGASFDSSTTDFRTEAELGALQDDRSVAGLGPIVAQDDGAIAPVSLETTTRYLGLFAQDRIAFTPQFSAQLSLRWNRARVELDDRIGTALDGKHRFSRLNPGISLEWRPAPELSVSAGYAETNRVPTPAELSCADEDAPCSLANFFIADPPLNQVVARSWRFGVTGEHQAGRWSLGWNANAFRITNADDIQHVASAIRGRAYFRNVGDTRRQGFEAQVNASSGPWRIHAGYAFVDARYLTDISISSPSNPQADDDGTIQVSKGDRLSAVPRHSGLLGIEYENGGSGFGADLVARSSSQLVGDESGENAPVPGFVIVNLHGKLAIKGGFSLFARVDNLFDREYASFGTFSEVDEIFLAEAPDASDARAYGPGSPRRWLAGIGIRY